MTLDGAENTITNVFSKPFVTLSNFEGETLYHAGSMPLMPSLTSLSVKLPLFFTVRDFVAVSFCVRLKSLIGLLVVIELFRVSEVPLGMVVVVPPLLLVVVVAEPEHGADDDAPIVHV